MQMYQHNCVYVVMVVYSKYPTLAIRFFFLHKHSKMMMLSRWHLFFFVKKSRWVCIIFWKPVNNYNSFRPLELAPRIFMHLCPLSIWHTYTKKKTSNLYPYKVNLWKIQNCSWVHPISFNPTIIFNKLSNPPHNCNQNWHPISHQGQRNLNYYSFFISYFVRGHSC